VDNFGPQTAPLQKIKEKISTYQDQGKVRYFILILDENEQRKLKTIGGKERGLTLRLFLNIFLAKAEFLPFEAAFPSSFYF